MGLIAKQGELGMCFGTERADEEAMDDQTSGFSGEVRSDATILVVDDEGGVRNLIQRNLTGAGYEVVMAPSGPEAITLMEGHSDRVDLLLVDVIMPKMSFTRPDLLEAVTTALREEIFVGPKRS